MNDMGDTMKKIKLIAKLVITLTFLQLSTHAAALNKAPFVPPIELGGSFKLFNQKGQQVTDDIMKGKYTIVLFGFSRCPHVCPGQLALLEKTLDSFPKIQALFITVDPENDTVDRLSEFSKSFHKRIVMLTGSREMIEKVISDYKVYVEASEDPEEFNHSTLMYLMGLDGRYITHIAPGDEDELLAFIQQHTK